MTILKFTRKIPVWQEEHFGKISLPQNNPHAKYFFIGIAEIHFVSIQTIIQDYFRIAMCKISFTPISLRKQLQRANL